MGKLALTIVAIALPDCLNPSLIGGELLVATRPRARRGVAVFTAAAFTVTFLFGVAFALGLGDLILSIVPKPGPTVKYSLITAAGVLMTVGGVIIIARSQALIASAPIPSDEDHGPKGSAAVIGAGLAGAELLTAFPYFGALALIVGSGVSSAGKLSLIILYCVIYTLPLIVIAVLFAVMGDRAGSVLRPVGDWLMSHWPLIVGPFTAALGVGVLAFGIIQLA